jgi:hypothetical protein
MLWRESNKARSFCNVNLKDFFGFSSLIIPTHSITFSCACIYYSHKLIFSGIILYKGIEIRKSTQGAMQDGKINLSLTNNKIPEWINLKDKSHATFEENFDQT